MAYEFPGETRIILPPPPLPPAPPVHLLDDGSLIHPTPPPIPPPPIPVPPYFVPVGPLTPPAPCSPVLMQNPVFVTGNTKFVSPQLVLRLNPLFLAQMDNLRTRSLLQYMADEDLEPSAEEEIKRLEVIEQLRQIVLVWIKKIAWRRCLPRNVIANTSATVLTYGSYGLGVHGPDSDIDALCVGPHYTNMEDDFFNVLCGMLENHPEVSELHCVQTAKVPLMRFKLKGISIDFPYARLPVISVPECVDVFDSSLLTQIDDTSWRSLSGVRANKCILNLVPDLKNFQSLLRCLKLWARRRGIYSHLFGFFGGIHLAILAGHVCQKYPNASVSALMCLFFETFSKWPWPEPVVLRGPYIPHLRPDVRSFMPILMPCSPFEWCNSNITSSTYRKIVSEFQRGYSLTRLQDPRRMEFRWSSLFEPYPYGAYYFHFVRILLTADTFDELRNWVGWVKSRLRGLLLKLEMVLDHCDPNPTEYVDHDVAKPNVVFYWGLSSIGNSLISICSLKEEFMKSVNIDHFADANHTECKLDLSIVNYSQLPKGSV